mmetsp:Transcript_3162/g.6705  ORF Transcript_3162/g.6705 Transcript_3162/m.6705 type:complete len:156 (+) Transcript_3162:260-727(+)
MRVTSLILVFGANLVPDVILQPALIPFAVLSAGFILAGIVENESARFLQFVDAHHNAGANHRLHLRPPSAGAVASVNVFLSVLIPVLMTGILIALFVSIAEYQFYRAFAGANENGISDKLLDAIIATAGVCILFLLLLLRSVLLIHSLAVNKSSK